MDRERWALLTLGCRRVDEALKDFPVEVGGLCLAENLLLQREQFQLSHHQLRRQGDSPCEERRRQQAASALSEDFLR
ncbi:hypothetical protein [Micromonospora sp. NPDC049282]|uniref:hypothetical protein n=1 Tax=Micromonospora sp. NPDC049282 TaxID=3364269 RepID=UPI003718DEBC